MKVVLAVLACAGLIVCGASCRREQPRDDVDLFRRRSDFFNYFIKPDSELLWRLKPGTYTLGLQVGEQFRSGLSGEFGAPDEIPPLRINELGMRGAEPAERKRELRILCLGDSVTFGYRTPWPEILEGALASNGLEAEVLNAGVPGHSLAQGRVWYRRELAALEPDLVVALFGWNDAKDRLRGYTDEELLSSGWKRLLSRILPPFDSWQGLDHPPLSEASGCCRNAPEAFHRELGLLSEEIAARGGSLLPATYPSTFDLDPWPGGFPEELAASRRARMDALNDTVRTAADESGLPLIDLAGAMPAQLGRAYFNDPLNDPIHPGELGAKAIALEIAREVLATTGGPGARTR